MQGTVDIAKRARIVPALAAIPSDIPRRNAHFAAYANNKGTEKPIVPIDYVPPAIPAYIRRANLPIAHTTSAARAMKLATAKSIARRPSAMCAIYLAT